MAQPSCPRRARAGTSKCQAGCVSASLSWPPAGEGSPAGQGPPNGVLTCFKSNCWDSGDVGAAGRDLGVMEGEGVGGGGGKRGVGRGMQTW